jgi:hypothetical protein
LDGTVWLGDEAFIYHKKESRKEKVTGNLLQVLFYLDPFFMDMLIGFPFPGGGITV